MRKPQFIAIAIAALLLVSLHFVNSKPDLTKIGEMSEMATYDIENIILKAKSDLDSLTTIKFLSLETEAATASTELTKEAEAYKKLAKAWNDLGRFDIGAHYSEKTAQLEQSSDAWSIAGHTFRLAASNPVEESHAAHLIRKAIDAFGKAAKDGSLKHKVDEAKMLVALSKVDAGVVPMEGINKLLELARADSTEVLPLAALAELAISRGGYDDALKRYKQVLASPKATLRNKYSTLMNMGMCYQELKEDAEAGKAYQEALKLALEDKEAQKSGVKVEQFSYQMTLAELYGLLGDKVGTLKSYENALKYTDSPKDKEELEKIIVELRK